jgi:hypothetical protein
MSLAKASGAIVGGAAILTAVITASGCDPYVSSGGNGASNAANVSLQYSFASGGAPDCTGSVTWIYAPLSLTGTTGRTGQITEPETYNVFSDASGQCAFGAGQLGLRKGTWRIQSTVSAGCDVSLQAAVTAVTFRQGMAGCTTTP